MPVDYRKYPADWKQIRARILERQCYMCDLCGVSHHAVGYRDEDGRFIANRGNGPCDASGIGESWPDGKLLSYSEAREFCDQYNDCSIGNRRCDDDGKTWFVIVLTVAHLDHDVTNNADSNLAALCQRCHLRYDAKHHAKNAKATRDRKRGQADMLADSAQEGGAR